MSTADAGMSRRVFAGSSLAALATLAAGRGGRPATAPLLGAASRAGAPGSRGTPPNVQVTSDGFAAHVEAAVAVNPAGPDRLLAACRVFLGTRFGLASYASADGGRSWQGNGLLPGTAGYAGGNATVAFDRRGTGYLCGIRGSGPSPGQLTQGDALLWRTSGHGRPLAPPVTAIPGGTGGVADHPGVAVDRGTAAPGRVHVTAVVFGPAGHDLVFCTSADGGQTFGPPRSIDPVTGTLANLPVIAAGPGGAVHIGYFVVTATGAALTVLSSADRGQTFAAPASLGSITATGPGLSDVVIKSGPVIAAAPRSSAVYAAMTSYDRASGRSQLLLFASPDAGRTWSGAVPVAASTSLAYLQAELAVDEAGWAALSCYAYDVAAQQANLVLFRSPPGPPDFSGPLLVSSQPFNPVLASAGGGTPWLGNYQGLGAGRRGFQPIWTDTRTGRAQLFTATVR